MKQLLYILAFTIALFTTACESTLENDVLPINENNLKGEWMVNAYFDTEEAFGPFSIQITSNNDSISINDKGDFWGFQSKAVVDKSNKAFESPLSVNELSEVGANIKILNGQLVGKDSISFNIQFEDDETPYGLTYTITGCRKS